MKERCIEFLIDDSGKLSAGRLLTFLIVLSFLYYQAVIFYRTGVLIDFPYALAGLIGTLYASSKFSPMYPYRPTPIVKYKPEEGDI